MNTLYLMTDLNTGGDRAAPATQIARAGLDTVQLVGHSVEPLNFLASVHAYAQPSRHEGLGILLHEAKQAALPMVAMHVGEFQQGELPGQTGALIAAGDMHALASVQVALARDTNCAAALGRADRAVLARAERVVASHYGFERRRASGSQLP